MKIQIKKMCNLNLCVTEVKYSLVFCDIIYEQPLTHKREHFLETKVTVLYNMRGRIPKSNFISPSFFFLATSPFVHTSLTPEGYHPSI